MKRQLVRFGVIGGAATLVHFLIVNGLVELCSMAALVANVIAYVVALQVSFWGHHHWSFSGHGGSKSNCMAKFVIVSLTGLLLNQLCFYLLLTYTSLDYRLALVVVLGVVAVFTFIMSKIWAFNERKI